MSAPSIELQGVKGTRDFYPEDMRIRQWLFAHWRAVAERFGYEEYDACVLEHEELYIRKAGDEITGQLYNFADKGGRRVALRPEMTPSLARMVMAKGAALALPLRWYAIPQCFRYENMQRGRKREHFQWNMDIIGLPGVAAEAELMAAQVAFLARVGLDTGRERPSVVIRVNNRQLIQELLLQRGIDGQLFPAVCVVIDKRDKIGDAATAAALHGLGIDASVATDILAVLSARGLEPVAALLPPDAPGLAALRTLHELADAYGFGHLLQIDLSVIRGLSYYTGLVWEVFATGGAFPRAIAGGGRYDRLVETLGGTPTPMVGFGFGDVVILEILADQGLLPPLARSVDDVIYPLTSRQFACAIELATALRAGQRRVSIDFSERRFKHAIQRAEQDGARRLLIIGEDEAASRTCTVRILGGERQEAKVPFAELMGSGS
jgi:histidyl-tRNA synthetase